MQETREYCCHSEALSEKSTSEQASDNQNGQRDIDIIRTGDEH